MNLPEQITMRASAFGDGAKGMAFQVSRNDEFGIQLSAKRERSGAPWINTFTSDHIPDREFKTFKELRDALLLTLPLEREVVVLETRPKSKGSTGHCWLCGTGEWIHTVIAKYGWRPTDQTHIPACYSCLKSIQADPAAALDARHEAIRKFDEERKSA